MTNPMFNPQPNYSGVTIQIANPSVYANGSAPQIPQGRIYNAGQNPYCIGNPYCQGITPPNGIGGAMPAGLANTYQQQPAPQNYIPQQPMAYPPQYYLNNYNYQNLPTAQQEIKNTPENEDVKALENKAAEDTKALQDEKTALTPQEGVQQDQIPAEVPEQTDLQSSAAEPQQVGNAEKQAKAYGDINALENDMTKSTNIIDDLDQRAAAAEEEKKNKKKDGIVPLTDEYIKSLENYLNNPNDEIRLMAAKEILTRLDEDKDRYDDAALNALLNKMLQDPSKLIRVASLSAFASQLASGNDYTVTLLHNIQQNPSADKEDVLQAADILLKMSAGKEITDIPNPSVKETPENKG